MNTEVDISTMQYVTDADLPSLLCNWPELWNFYMYYPSIIPIVEVLLVHDN